MDATRRHALLALLLSMAALAGCAQPPAPPATTTPGLHGDAAPPPERLADLASEGCVYNDIIFLVPASLIQEKLPKGFTARQMVGPNGGMVINHWRCADGFAWMGADMFAMIEPPKVPAIVDEFDALNRTPRADSMLPLDVYMLAAHTDHEDLRAIFKRAGVPLGGGVYTKTSVPAPAAAPGTVSQGTLKDANGTLVSYTVTGRDAGAFIPHHRQWRQTDEGLILVERVLTVDGKPVPLMLGPARCEVAATSTFAPILGGVPCSIGQDIPVPFGWTGGAYIFPGVVVGAS